jgi:hypothetical protein
MTYQEIENRIIKENLFIKETFLTKKTIYEAVLKDIRIFNITYAQYKKLCRKYNIIMLQIIIGQTHLQMKA